MSDERKEGEEEENEDENDKKTVFSSGKEFQI